MRVAETTDNLNDKSKSWDNQRLIKTDRKTKDLNFAVKQSDPYPPLCYSNVAVPPRSSEDTARYMSNLTAPHTDIFVVTSSAVWLPSSMVNPSTGAPVVLEFLQSTRPSLGPESWRIRASALQHPHYCCCAVCVRMGSAVFLGVVG
ncbi:hypothetical protein N7G274_000567 [Stereocaulon virgatum]|uniref:Uncharacterized protein n=1 Tax=Stereocaulon virgatum TaxID=373712 RepID=A0ABR4AT69_9LECA